MPDPKYKPVKGSLADWQTLSFTRWLHIMGGGIFDERGRVTIHSQQAQRTLDMLIDFNDQVVGGPAELEQFHRRYSRNTQENFENGRVAFFMWNDYVWGLLKGSRPNLRLSMGIAPYASDLGPRSIVQPGWGYGIFDSAHPEEAWLLLQWLTLEEEGGLEFAISQGRPSAVASWNLDPAYLDQHDYWPVIIESFANAAPFAPRPAGVQTDDVVQQLLNDTALSPRLGVADALAEAQRLLEARIGAVN